MDKASLKEQLQINLLQVFEDVGICDEDQNFDNNVRDVILDHMCNVIIKTIDEASKWIIFAQHVKQSMCQLMERNPKASSGVMDINVILVMTLP